MKKLTLIALFMFLLVLGSMAVSAALVPSETFGATSPMFGSKNQDASNPNAESDVNREIFVTKTLTLTNNGTSSVTVNTSSLTITPASGFTTISTDILKGVNISVVTEKTIAAGATDTVDFKARIPAGLNSVDDTLFKPQAFKVATLTLPSTTTPIEVFMQRKNELEFKNIDVEVKSPSGGRRESTSISTRIADSQDSGDQVEGVKPGDSVNIEVSAENKFSDNDDVDIDDVEVRYSIDTSDFDEDDDEDLGDLGSDDEDSVTFTTSVDDDAEDGSGEIEFITFGTDDHGARHGQRLTADFEIERETHDLIIRRASLSQNQVSCDDTSTQLSVRVDNIGKRDEDEVAIEVLSTSLDYKKRVVGIELDEDDSQTELFDVNFARSLPEGVYALQVQTFYDSTILSNSEVVQLTSTCTEAGKAVTPLFGVKELSLEQNSFNVEPGRSISIPVKVTNTVDELKAFTVSLQNLDQFSDSSASKSSSLNPGQSTTLVFNVEPRSNAKAGKYTLLVTLKEATGFIVTTETVTVDVKEAEKKAETTPTTTTGLDTTGNLFAIGYVVLVIVAILVIVVIFKGGRKKPVVA